MHGFLCAAQRQGLDLLEWHLLQFYWKAGRGPLVPACGVRLTLESTYVVQFAGVNLVSFSDEITLSWWSCFVCLLSRPVKGSADLTGIKANA